MLRAQARARLDAAYANIPDNLHKLYCLPPCKPAREKSFRSDSHEALLALGNQLGPGFPRVVNRRGTRIDYVKGMYRKRFVDPNDDLFPKIIEVRNKDYMPVPKKGEIIQIEDFNYARVVQVGGFKDLAAWQMFPFKGAGGVGVGPDEDIHEIAMLSVNAFKKGKIWWALVTFLD